MFLGESLQRDQFISKRIENLIKRSNFEKNEKGFIGQLQAIHTIDFNQNEFDSEFDNIEELNLIEDQEQDWITARNTLNEFDIEIYHNQKTEKQDDLSIESHSF